MTLAPMVLASSSRYRREQLARIGLDAENLAPNVDETRLAGEPPAAMAQRLARTKAMAVAQRRPDALIIAADQVAALGETIFGKPGNATAQRAQLRACRNQEVLFFTALALVDAPSGRLLEHLDLTRCQLRDVDDAAIARYVTAEPAYDCAGGFKVEGRGIALFERITSNDPSALIGLPLIALGRMLRECGRELP